MQTGNFVQATVWYNIPNRGVNKVLKKITYILPKNHKKNQKITENRKKNHKIT